MTEHQRYLRWFNPAAQKQFDDRCKLIVNELQPTWEQIYIWVEEYGENSDFVRFRVIPMAIAMMEKQPEQ